MENKLWKDDGLTIIAGPCAVESRDQLLRIAEAVKEAGADMLRGGAFKPRTNPGEFEGLGIEGLAILAEAKEMFGLPVVTEIMDVNDVDAFAMHSVDVYQIGARTMQAYKILEELDSVGVEVLLKNGMNSSVKEWIGAAKRIKNAEKCTLCFRGKNNETDVARNGADIVSMAYLLDSENKKYRTIFDPSHSAGKRNLIYPVSIAAAQMGFDGLIIEVHDQPDTALCDGKQSLLPKELKILIRDARELYEAGREMRKRYETEMGDSK